MVGERLLHYEIVQKLGEGGMGVVYKARDTHLDRFVAIKVLPQERIASPQREARFVQEAKAASALNHPNIIVVHDVASDRGTDFIAMEYVAGKTLHQLISRTGMRLGEALKIAIQIADALARAHSAGIVHRDLKPSNIMVDEHGHVKVLDFGLAKLTEQRSSEHDATAMVAVDIDEGTIVGTAAYMSPEQAEGKAVDARSDIFSFGCVLYEMVSGRRAFPGDTPVATLSAILQKEPRAVEGLPADLEKLIARCLRKDPARRIQHMIDVRLALEDLKEESDSGKLSPPVARPRGRNPVLLVALLGALLLLGAGVVWFVGRGGREIQAPSAPAPLTSYSGNELEPSFSPDGNQVAFVWDGEQHDNADIYVKLIGSERPLRLTSDPADDISPAWSPDGRFIAFVRKQTSGERKAAVYVVPAIGGPERLVVELGAALGASTELRYIALAPHPLVSWAQGGRSLLFVDRASVGQPFNIFLISPESGERRQLTSAPAGFLGDGAPSVSPDGRNLLFSRALNMTSCDLYRLPLTSDFHSAGPAQRLTSFKQWTATPVWIPAVGDILFSTGGKFDGPFRLWRMTPEPGVEPRALAAYGEAGWPAYSPVRSRLVFSRSETDSNIWRVPLLGPAHAGVPTKLIASTREDNVPQYSPDGSKIAFTSNRTGQHEVWVCASDGSNAVQLTSLQAGMTGSPHWSPDGKQIVFDSTIEGQFQIYTVNAAGRSPRRLTSHRSDNAVASYSRDGRFIYFSSNRTGEWQIFKMPAEGGEPVQITQNGGRGPLESPDGRFIFYERAHAGQPWGLWKCPVNGGQKETQVTPSVGFINFTVTEEGVYVIPRSDSDPTATIQFLGFSASSARSVFTINHPVTTGLAISPDRKFLLYTQIDERGSDLMLVDDFR